MDNKKQLGSSSSFGADLSSPKKFSPPASSTGIFASIFPPPSSVVGRNYSSSELGQCLQEQSTRDGVLSKKQVTAEIIVNEKEGTNNSTTNKERIIFLERVETCPLSSSLYYGGLEDMYICSSSSKSSTYYPLLANNGVEDDPYGYSSESASRGDWWQGSLYY